MAMDVAGNTSRPSASRGFTVDTVVPALLVLTAVEGARVHKGMRPDLPRIIDGCAARVFPLSLEGSCPGLGDDFSVSRGKVFGGLRLPAARHSHAPGTGVIVSTPASSIFSVVPAMGPEMARAVAVKVIAGGVPATSAR